jgi:Fic family protein
MAMVEKIGTDVLRKYATNVLYHQGYSADKVYSAIKDEDGLLNISQIARKAGVSWVTAKSALYELIRLGLVEEVRVGNMIKFRVRR